MYLADVQPIDATQCKILVGYDSHVAGEPRLSQIERFVESRWNNAVVAQATTARNHDGAEAVSILVTANVPTRNVADATVMRRITAGTYMDNQTGHVWVVADNGTNKYLMRRPEKPIEEIVGAPERVSRKQARFEDLRTASAMVGEGDTVRFWDGSMPMVGKVTSSAADSLSVSANGRSYKISPEAVFNVVERSESRLSGEQSTLEDYYARAFGSEDFARKFTRKLNRQEDPLSSDTGWSGGGSED
tara:strand:- start:3834 stop:4571 length:738 start_codon:yes stop_codon:yes gene_type:complete